MVEIKTHRVAIKDVAESVESNLLARIARHPGPPDLHVTRRHHLKLIIPAAAGKNFALTTPCQNLTQIIIHFFLSRHMSRLLSYYIVGKKST